MNPLKNSMVVTSQQNGGETWLDFSNGASTMMLESILNLSLAKSNGKNDQTCNTGHMV
jgi:hypothetical protein